MGLRFVAPLTSSTYRTAFVMSCMQTAVTADCTGSTRSDAEREGTDGAGMTWREELQQEISGPFCSRSDRSIAWNRN